MLDHLIREQWHRLLGVSDRQEVRSDCRNGFPYSGRPTPPITTTIPPDPPHHPESLLVSNPRKTPPLSQHHPKLKSISILSPSREPPKGRCLSSTYGKGHNVIEVNGARPSRNGLGFCWDATANASVLGQRRPLGYFESPPICSLSTRL